jgi:branched-chain amino acid transport system ATP-binding protein
VTTEPAALEIDGLISGYRTAEVLHGVSLTVPSASVVTLLGANGAGKSTLLKTVCGLIPARAGTIRVGGEDVTQLATPERARRGVCYIPEGRGVFRSLTVRENLVLQAPPGEQDQAIARAREAFPVLGDRLGQTAGTLSGGEQQMLAVAQAYVREPRLILVDEASLGLAPMVVSTIFDFLRSVNERGASLLIVDQFVARALDMATSAYVIRRGTIVYSGDTTALRDGNVFRHYLGTEDDDEAQSP